MDNQEWFGVKCLVEHGGLSREPGGRVYEERVVIIRAKDFDEAIERAEVDAKRYAAQNRGTYIGYCNAYRMEADSLADGTEVFSLTREVLLTPTEFVARYYDDGTDKHH
jgi:hypothetical protein